MLLPAGDTLPERVHIMTQAGVALAKSGEVGEVEQVIYVSEGWVSPPRTPFLRPSQDPNRTEVLEAIRKPFRTVAARSSSLLAVMKHRATAGSKSVQHKMDMTDLDHRRTGFYTALIVLTVPSVPAMPGVRPLNHPAFLQRRKAFRARWPCLHFDAPPGTMLGHPGVQSVIVILLIRKDRDETRKVLGRDVAEQESGPPPHHRARRW